MIWALCTVNQSSKFQQALGAGFVLSIGNCGGFVSSWSFRSSEAPHYANGLTNCLILTCVAAGLSVLTWLYIEIANRRAVGRTESVEKRADGGNHLLYRP